MDRGSYLFCPKQDDSEYIMNPYTLWSKSLEG